MGSVARSVAWTPLPPGAGRDGRKVLYLPWDVLRVILPEVVEALDSPDRVAL